MGNDPGSSVVDKYHRTHDVPNLFLCDGSSFVTSGRGQPAYGDFFFLRTAFAGWGGSSKSRRSSASAARSSPVPAIL